MEKGNNLSNSLQFVDNCKLIKDVYFSSSDRRSLYFDFKTLFSSLADAILFTAAVVLLDGAIVPAPATQPQEDSRSISLPLPFEAFFCSQAVPLHAL